MSIEQNDSFKHLRNVYSLSTDDKLEQRLLQTDQMGTRVRYSNIL